MAQGAHDEIKCPQFAHSFDTVLQMKWQSLYSFDIQFYTALWFVIHHNLTLMAVDLNLKYNRIAFVQFESLCTGCAKKVSPWAILPIFQEL